MFVTWCNLSRRITQSNYSILTRDAVTSRLLKTQRLFPQGDTSGISASSGPGTCSGSWKNAACLLINLRLRVSPQLWTVWNCGTDTEFCSKHEFPFSRRGISSQKSLTALRVDRREALILKSNHFCVCETTAHDALGL